MNLANVWEAVAAELGDRPALLHGGVATTWVDFERRAAGVAGHLQARGIGPDAKVALYLHNGPEYAESTFAAFKGRAVPVNVNYRYLAHELEYLLDNSDAEAVVVSAALLDRLEEIRPGLDRIRTVLVVGARTGAELPEGAVDFEDAAAGEPASPLEGEMSDLWFLYTGGTTGMPKGVMWPHSSLLAAAAPTYRIIGADVPGNPAEAARTARAFADAGRSVRMLAAAPLMHGTAGNPMLGVLGAGGSVVTLTSRSFDAAELCEAVQREQVGQLNIVGDAFAKPIVAELDAAAAAGRPWDLSSLRVVVSSGVMWSRATKDALLEHCDAVLADLLGSSEGTGMAASLSRRGASADTARFFSLGEHATVLTEDGRHVEPGSGEQGLLAVGGPIPVGYYKDPDKTAETFRTVDGRVWSVPGDHATVEADGTITLLGRGSVCINTGGEKVYPEEVEEALKVHPAVHDANVVGLPDETWGQRVCAVVSLEPDVQVGVEALREHCRSELAGYKCPKQVVVVDRVQRGPNGKPDYRWAAEVLGG